MMFSTLQSFLFVGILYFNFSDATPVLNNPMNAAFWMVFVSLVATLMGLLLSATVSTAEKVMSLVPIALIPQIMLAGILTKISNVFIEFLSYFAISRWATEGFNNIQEELATPKFSLANKDQLASGAEPKIVEAPTEDVKNAVAEIQKQFHEDYPSRFGDLAGTLELDFYMLGALALLFFVLIFWFIKKKDTIQING
jgi:hypothetical protein